MCALVVSIIRVDSIGNVWYNKYNFTFKEKSHDFNGI